MHMSLSDDKAFSQYPWMASFLGKAMHAFRSV